MAFVKHVLMLVFYNVLQGTNSEFRCGAEITGCMCNNSTNRGVCDIQCPMDDPNVIIEVQLKLNYVKVDCRKEINWNNQNLPSLEMEDLRYLKFFMCSPPEYSFSELMNRLRINGTKELSFTDSGNFESIVLTSDYFQSVQGLEKLTLSNNNLKNINEDAFKLLDTLTELDLSSNKIQLADGLFRYLTKLTYLNLSQNQLTSIPLGLLQNLTELKMLHLWANKLTTLNSGIFRNLRNLKLLELSSNELVELPENAFFPLQNLTKLSLSTNKLRSVPENLFMKNILIEHINMKRNPSLILPENFFSNLTKLESVLLDECKLTSLPSNLFNGSVHLKVISLRTNEIEYLPKNIFVGLEELYQLDVSYNKIRDLPDQIFSPLKELKTLNLRDNLLIEIRQQSFYNLKKVEIINLKNNRISFIHIETFYKAESLKEIVLANNSIDFPHSTIRQTLFQENRKLENLDLSHNHITTITDDFQESLISLRTLNLSYNHLTDLEFANVFTASYQIELDLTYNKITTINFSEAEFTANQQPNGDFSHENRVVYLGGNPIECDCRIYDFVRYFDHSVNSLVPTFVKIKADNLLCASPPGRTGDRVDKLNRKLLTCSFSQGIIETISLKNCTYEHRRWDNTAIVNCTNRYFTEVPELTFPVGQSFNQTEVYLARNLLTSGPKENMGYENVTKLFLSFNNISEFTWIPPNLEILELDNNNISHLSDNTLSTLKTSSIINITLGNNPWNCDCSAANLNTFLVSHLANKRFDVKNIICRNTGKLLVSLTGNDLCPTYISIALGFGITICLICLVVAVLVALYFKYKVEIKVWLYARNMCLWFVTEEEIDKDKLYDAFISYSHKDEEFVVNELIPVLEEGPQSYKLCLHIRDFTVGEFISKQIVESVANSRRTLVILSRDFLKSEWGIMEFRTAHKQAILEGRARVILILYGDIDIESDLDEELKAYTRTNTYVKWGDPYFWEKLRYALPHFRSSPIDSGPTTPNCVSTPTAMIIDPLLLKNNPFSFTPSYVS